MGVCDSLSLSFLRASLSVLVTKRRLKITHHEDELASVKMLSVFGCSLRANSCSPAVSTFCASAICSAVV